MTNAFSGDREWIHAHEYATKLILWGVIVVALLAAFAWQRMKYERARAALHALALRAVNDSARADTTRHLALARGDSLRTLGDSLAAVTRLTVQVAPQADALDRALREVRTATQTLNARIAALAVRVGSSEAVHTESDGARTASFTVDTTPYHGTVGVVLPPVGRGAIDLRLRIDPAVMAVRSECGPANAAGIRAASVVVTGPRWLDVAVARSEQTPEVCNAEPTVHHWVGWGALAGVGYVANAHGAGPGMFLGIGGRFGP